jgi:hypothetical protein
MKKLNLLISSTLLCFVLLGCGGEKNKVDKPTEVLNFTLQDAYNAMAENVRLSGIVAHRLRGQGKNVLDISEQDLPIIKKIINELVQDQIDDRLYSNVAPFGIEEVFPVKAGFNIRNKWLMPIPNTHVFYNNFPKNGVVALPTEGVPLLRCKKGEPKYDIAELIPVGRSARGVDLIQVGNFVYPVFKDESDGVFDYRVLILGSCS